MSKLLAVDLDGTLFYPRQLTRRIPKKNIKFLREWIDSGNRVVLISSRSYEFTEQLNEEIQRPVDFINYNGGQIRIRDVLIKDSPMDNKDLEVVLKKILDSKKTIAYLVSSDKFPAVLRDNVGFGKPMRAFYRIWYWMQGQYREHYIVDNDIFDSEIKNGKVYCVRMFFGVKKNKKLMAKEVNKTVRTEFPNIESSWTDLMIELTPKGSHKADALQYYIDKNGIDKKDVYVVGDSGNDITMFANFYEHSYCMAHSNPSVKKYAKSVISRVYKLDNVLKKKGAKHE